MERLSAANTHFSLNLFKKISAANASGNVFYSPVSISSALAMVALGAKGNTADQMFKVLGYNSPLHPDAATSTAHYSAEQIHSSFNKFMSELNKPVSKNKLSLANRLYGEQSYQFLEKFLRDTKRYYEAELEEVDFKMKSEAARFTINKWVERKTNEKIKDLVPRGAVDSNTKLVLVNAIYFKADWEKKFKKQATSDGFKLNKIQKKTVKMMHQKAHFALGSIKEMNSQVLELPYVGKNLSMLIILPNEIADETTGLQKLERALTYEKLMEWTKPSMMHQQEVEVTLPKFRVEETYDMKRLLTSMGMEDVFDPQKVNLSGMSSSNELGLSEVIHKSFVAVDEEGTEAAAATAIVGTTATMPTSPKKTFIADHPFLYFIRHNPSNAILFYGRLSSP